MKKIKYYHMKFGAGIALIVLFLLVACSENRTMDKQTLAELKTRLMAGEDIGPQKPFRMRRFEPYLNGKWIGEAISYGCYRKGQAPGVKGPSEEQILEDLTIIKQYWNLIRIYGSDDDAQRILNVIRKNKLPIKVLLGIWLVNETENPEARKNNVEQVLRGIQLANEFKDIVIAVNVGNETQVFWSWHRMAMDDLIRYIRIVRKNISQPVTTADDYNFWNKEESKKVASEIDFIAANFYALWNGITLEKAIPWTDSVYRALVKFHANRPVIISETGWATRYNPDKKGPGEQGALIKGEVSMNAQREFLIRLHEWVQKHKVVTFLFEAFDEPWKGGGDASGPNEIEKNWGVFFENRTPKPSFLEFLKRVNSEKQFK